MPRQKGRKWGQIAISELRLLSAFLSSLFSSLLPLFLKGAVTRGAQGALRSAKWSQPKSGGAWFLLKVHYSSGTSASPFSFFASATFRKSSSAWLQPTQAGLCRALFGSSSPSLHLHSWRGVLAVEKRLVIHASINVESMT